MEHPDEAEENIRNQDKQVNFISRELSKKRKLEEELNLPLSKHKFKTKQIDSERECPLFDACSLCNDSSRSTDFVTLPETDCAVSEVTFLNESTVLASNARKLDSNADIDMSDSIGYSTINRDGNVMFPSSFIGAKSNRDGNVMFSGSFNGAKSSSLLQFSLDSLDPADGRPISFSTGYSCTRESSKEIARDASRSYNQLYHPTANQSCNIPSKQSSGSSHSCTTFVGLEVSDDSMHSVGRKESKRRTTTDLDCLHVNLQDCIHDEDKRTHQSYLEHDQFDRCLTKDGTPRAKENDVNLRAVDITETNFVGSLDSVKSAIGKRHKSVNTTSGTWEFGSGSRKGSHVRVESQLVASTDSSSLVEYGSSQNSRVCYSKGITSPCRHIGGSITSKESYRGIDANDETYSDRQTINNEISADINEPLPSYVLSSGRVTRKEEEHRSSRSLTIDQDFEQYFSQLML